MEAGLDLPRVAPLLEKDFVVCWVDVDRMKGGKELNEAMGAERSGLPWWVLLDAVGKPLADSDDPTGDNIGCPYREAEVEAFCGLLLQSRLRLTEAEIGAIAAALHEAGERGDKARKAAKEAEAARAGDAKP